MLAASVLQALRASGSTCWLRLVNGCVLDTPLCRPPFKGGHLARQVHGTVYTWTKLHCLIAAALLEVGLEAVNDS